MSEELITDNTVPVETTEETVSPSENVALPDVNEQESKEGQEERRFTQAELDSIVAKAKAKERRKMERERMSQVEIPTQTEDFVPKIHEFDSVEEYERAVKKAAEDYVFQKEAVKKQVESHSNDLHGFKEKEEDIIDVYPDYEEVVYKNEKLAIDDIMAQAIIKSDAGPEIAYYLGKNPAEAVRISKIPDQIKRVSEIAKIESKVTRPTKKVSNAPSPINPVVPKGTSSNYAASDPRSLDHMSTSEWIQKRREEKYRLLSR